MRIFNKNKTEELNRDHLDFDKGYLDNDKLFIAHHPAIEAVKEKGHYKTIANYPNGGKDVEWVVDVPAVTAREAYDEYEDIQIYIPYSEAEIAEREIEKLKQKLAATDYQAIKYAEGALSESEFANMRAQRQEWRKQINKLELLI